MLKKHYAPEFWAEYGDLAEGLMYLSTGMSGDTIWSLYRSGIGPVCHLSYAPDLDCIMGVGTRKGYENEGLASWLIEYFIKNLTSNSVTISSFSEQGSKYLRKKFVSLAKAHKINILQYDNVHSVINNLLRD